MQFTVRHVFHTDLDTYWNEIFFSPEYNRRLYSEALGFKGFEVVELTGEPGGVRTRTMRTEPAAEAPAVVKKLIGDTLTYTEKGTFDPSTGVWTYDIKTSKLSDKVTIAGRLWAEPVAAGVERVAEIGVDVRVFGVGGAIEKFIEKTTRDSYVKASQFTNDYIREKGLLAGRVEAT
ncbi:MAG: DUF2505 domain-containing protein [Sandaracinaceae bacterium]|nr:DUF2505 domain-containing protein [Sandaracinaceae bacterium]